MSRREFPKRIRLEIVHRAMNAKGQVVCEGCGLILAGKRYEIDHVIPEALVVDKTAVLTASAVLTSLLPIGAAGPTATDGDTKDVFRSAADLSGREAVDELTRRGARSVRA